VTISRAEVVLTGGGNMTSDSGGSQGNSDGTYAQSGLGTQQKGDADTGTGEFSQQRSQQQEQTRTLRWIPEAQSGEAARQSGWSIVA
ncbi:MAG: hypothetical protein P4M02_00500, partial [Clostridia bacterium]|nr:hypothetical protein [Clostridia bacterium]